MGLLIKLVEHSLMDFLTPRPQSGTLILSETFCRLLDNVLNGQVNQFLSFTAQAQKIVFEEPLHFPLNSNNYNVDSKTQTSLNLHSIAVSMKILFYRWRHTDHLRLRLRLSKSFTSPDCPEYRWPDTPRV